MIDKRKICLEIPTYFPAVIILPHLYIPILSSCLLVWLNRPNESIGYAAAIATDVAVAWSVCPSVTLVHRARAVALSNLCDH